MESLSLVFIILMATATSGSIIPKEELHQDVTRGESVILTCNFNKSVNCAWDINGYQLSIPQDNYTYVDHENNGKQTTNCSIQIHHANKNNQGRYVCSSTGTDTTNDARNETVITLYVTDPTVVEHPPNELVVGLGQDAFLSCRWNTQVDCKWKYNNVTVAGDKYMYNERDSNCFLKIRNVALDDEGTWKCVDGQNQTTTSQEMQLKIENQPRPLIFGCSENLECAKEAAEAPKDPDTSMYCQSSDGYPEVVLNWHVEPQKWDVDVTFQSRPQQNWQNRNGTYNSVLKLNQEDVNFLINQYSDFNVFCSCKHLSNTEKVHVLHFPSSPQKGVEAPTACDCKNGTEFPTCAPPTTYQLEFQHDWRSSGTTIIPRRYTLSASVLICISFNWLFYKR